MTDLYDLTDVQRELLKTLLEASMSQAIKPLTKNHVEYPLLFPYREFSRGGKALAAALSIHYFRRMKGLGFLLNNVATPPPLVIINWGTTGDIPGKLGFPIKHIFNKTSPVATASDKLLFFKNVQGKARIPEFTTDFETAMAWHDSGQVVLGRTRRGSCGMGIAFFDEDFEAFNGSEFWVQYKKKKDEFRVHIAFGKVIDVQRKALRKTDHEGNPIDVSSVDFRIRNLTNGFVFQRHDITVPHDVIEQAMKAMEASGLDFGAVDVIYNSTENKGYVLEINTAPGLEGTTIESYANAFRPVLEQHLTKKEA